MTNDTPTLQLAVWDDPLAANGLQTDTDDALIYLTPLLGPTSTLTLHRLSRCSTAERHDVPRLIHVDKHAVLSTACHRCGRRTTGYAG